MKTKAVRHNCGLTFNCSRCGIAFDQNCSCILVMEDDGETIRDGLGDLCQACAVAATNDKQFTQTATLEDLAIVEADFHIDYCYSVTGDDLETLKTEHFAEWKKEKEESLEYHKREAKRIKKIHDEWEKLPKCQTCGHVI